MRLISLLCINDLMRKSLSSAKALGLTQLENDVKVRNSLGAPLLTILVNYL